MKLICSLVLLLFYQSAFPQPNFSNKIDSLTLLLKKPHTHFLNAKILDQLQYYWQFKNLAKSIEVGNKAVFYAKKSGKNEMLAEALSNLAFSYMLAGDAYKSIELLFQLIETDKKFSSMAWAFLAMNYRNQQEYATALKYAKMSEFATSEYRIPTDDRHQFGDQINRADLHEKLNQIDSAFISSSKAYKMVQNKNMPKGGESFAWEARHIHGKVLLRKGQLKKGYQMLQDAMKHSNLIGDDMGDQTISLTLAEYFDSQNQKDSAIYYSKKSFDTSKKNGNLYFTANAGNFLSKMYEQKKRYELAVYYNRLATLAKDSIVNARNTFKYQSLTRQEEKKREEIEKIKEQEKANADKKLLLLGLFFMSLFAIIMYKNKTNTDALNKKLHTQNIEIESFNKNLEQKVTERTQELENAIAEIKVAFNLGQTSERKRVSADLHDEIGSALSTIAIFSDISKNKALKTAPNMVEEIEKIGVKSREMIQTMKDTVWSLNEDNNASLLDKLWQYATETLGQKNLKINWNVSDNQYLKNVSPSTKRNIYLACKEALNNIVKHAQASEVSFDCIQNEGFIELIIADNGIGFDLSEKTGKGNGLKNFETRMRDIGATVDITSKKGQGTTLKFILPNA